MPSGLLHTCNKEKEIAVLQTDISYIREKIDNMDHKLLGNGKPGLLAEQSARISEMERKMWKFAGAVGVIVFLLGILVPKIVNALLGN
jgi:hypothetical protein